MTAKLTIRLLGQPSVLIDQRPVNIQRRQTRALLFFLAGNAGMVGRSELITRFFNAEIIPDEVARRRLRELISKLRSNLPDPEVLVTGNDQVGLDPELVDLDLLTFEHLYRSIEGRLKKHVYGHALPTEILPVLENAVGLWYGTDFLQGLILDEQPELQRWHMEKNARLCSMRENLLKHLAGHAAAINDLEGAAHWLKKVLELNQYNSLEDVYHLMSILKQLGRLNEASKLASLLKNRYDIDGETMPPELEALYTEITNQFSPEAGGDWDAWGKTFTIQTPLVGRQKELQKLKKTYLEKEAVIIWGEPGMGKTRLVYEFYHSLTPSPHLMVATCHQMEQNQPYEPLMDMLQQFITLPEWEKMDKADLAALAPFIPSVINQLNIPVKSEAVQPSPAMVNEAIYRVLHLKTTSARGLIFIKNVQWCDESTLNALIYLLKKKFFQHQGFLILTGLASEKKAAFDAFVNGINRQSTPYEIIFLNALKESEVGQLAAFILGSEPSSDIVRKMTVESGGSPFVLSEYLRWHLQKNPGKDLNEMIKEMTIPSNVSNLMRARIRELDLELRQVINAAAVVGPQFTLDSVAVVSDLEKEVVAGALERLEDNHLIKSVVKADPIGGYIFTFPRMRQLVLNEIKTARKQLMYQRMAQYLELRSGQRISRPIVLAQYFENGGDEVKAFTYWFQAAENAFRISSHSETAAALKAGEAILTRQPDLLADEQLMPFLNLYVDFYRNQIDDQTLFRITHFTLDLGQRRRSSLLLGAGLRFQAIYEIKKGQILPAIKSADEALRHLNITPYVNESLCTYNLKGDLYRQSNRLIDSGQTFEHTRQKAETALFHHPGDVRILKELALADDGLASLLIFKGMPQAAADGAERAIESLEMCFDYRGLAQAQITLAEAKFQMGAYDQALDVAKRALRTITGLQANELMVLALLIYARAWIMLGYFDESWRLLDQAADLCETYPVSDQKAQIHLARGLIFRLLRNYESAADENQTAVSCMGSTYTASNALLNYGMCMKLVNRNDESARYINEALEIANENEFAGLQLMISQLKAAEIGNHGDFDQACRILETLSEKANQRGLRQIGMSIYFNYGSFMLAKGNFSVARRLVSPLIGQDTLPGPWTEMNGLFLLHQINQREGRNDSMPMLRTAEILDHIHSQTSLPSLKDQFERFSHEVLHWFEQG
jgi:tetratricopeptide (TPR) repeat protein